MGEIARRFAVELHALDTQALQQAGHDQAADAVDGVHDDLETGRPDGFSVHVLQRQDGIQVLFGEVMLRDAAQLRHRCEIEFAAFGAVQDGLAFGRREELAPLVQELEGVPLLRVMGGRQDDAAVRAGESHRHLGRGRRGESRLDDIHAAGDQGAADQLLHHGAAQARILADHHLIACAVGMGPALAQGRAIGIGEFDNINRRQALSGPAADRTSDAGDGFDQRHGNNFFFRLTIISWVIDGRS